MRVYDPRVDRFVESDNPALIARWMQYGDARQDDFTETRIAQMADYCDEPVSVVPLQRRG